MEGLAKGPRNTRRDAALSRKPTGPTEPSSLCKPLVRAAARGNASSGSRGA